MAETTATKKTKAKSAGRAAKPKSQKVQVVYRSPLADKTGGGVLQMQEIGGQTLINLRGKADDEAFMEATQNALGAPPPTTPNTTTAITGGVIFWLGADDWLVRFFRPPADNLLPAWRQSLSAAHAAITDVSDYYTIIRIAGGGARDALAAGCPLDLHSFRGGSCAQSHFAKAAILLYQRDITPTFELQVRWSYADYVWEYLRTAAGDS